MDRTLECISDYAVSLSFDNLPASTVHATKQRFIDSMGCALGGYSAEPSQIARRLCYAGESPMSARVIGSLTSTSAEMAAFANSTMVRYLDFNDAYRMKDGGHPSDAICAALAVAEAVHADGERLITAIVLAYELQCRIIEQVPLDQKGWDQPIYVATGSALAAGKILGLTKDQLANAVSLALAPNIALYQTRVGELSMWKAAAAGMAARQGVFASLLAREGMTGPEEVFEGQFGLFNQVTGPINMEDLGGSGRQFAIGRTNIKSYPVRDSCQLVVRTALGLRELVDPADIESVHVKTYASAYRWAVAPGQLWAPKTRETADHSIPFSIAAALIDGDVSPETFSRDRFLDSDALELMGKMHIEDDPEFSRQTPALRNCRIEAITRSGKTHVSHLTLTADEIETGMTDGQVTSKYNGLVKDVLTPTLAENSLELMWRLDALEDASKVLDHLRVHGSTS
jgi:2-methylcitrate dehydratase